MTPDLAGSLSLPSSATNTMSERKFRDHRGFLQAPEHGTERNDVMWNAEILFSSLEGRETIGMTHDSRRAEHRTGYSRSLHHNSQPHMAKTKSENANRLQTAELLKTRSMSKNNKKPSRRTSKSFQLDFDGGKNSNFNFCLNTAFTHMLCGFLLICLR